MLTSVEAISPWPDFPQPGQADPTTEFRCDQTSNSKPTAAQTRSRLLTASKHQGGAGFLLAARVFGGCFNPDDRGIAGASGGIPGSFARIRRNIFIRRDVGS